MVPIPAIRTFLEMDRTLCGTYVLPASFGKYSQQRIGSAGLRASPTHGAPHHSARTVWIVSRRTTSVSLSLAICRGPDRAACRGAAAHS
jgi:hypothetical protein